MSEVIIDGCNVAECEFYDRYNYTTCMIGIQNYIDCNKNPNCMFKQLQRAKAENEKLKKEVETWNYQAEKRAEIGDVWYDTALKYKQALEDIKAKADTQIFSCMGCDAYNECKNCENKNAREFAVNTKNKINEVLN